MFRFLSKWHFARAQQNHQNMHWAVQTLLPGWSDAGFFSWLIYRWVKWWSK